MAAALLPLSVFRARLLRSSFFATLATGLALDFGAAFSFLLATDFERDARLLGAGFSVATFFGVFTFLTLFERVLLRGSAFLAFAGVCLRADLGAGALNALFATEAFAYALATDALVGDLDGDLDGDLADLAGDFEGDLEGDFAGDLEADLACDFATDALATDDLATDAFATEALATLAFTTLVLATLDLATLALATEAFLTEVLATEGLAVDAAAT